MILNDYEYMALLDLYHKFNTAFLYLPDYLKEAFFRKLYGKE